MRALDRFIPSEGAVACAVAGLLCLASPAAAEEPVPVHARWRPSKTYYLHVPSGYAESGHARWPLFVAVHSGMSSGRGEFLLWQQYADQNGFLLVSPNFSEGFQSFSGDSDYQLLKIVEEVSAEYRVDRSKVLLSGVGDGGEFVYRFAMRYPGFAHTVVMVHPGELPDPARARRGESPRFYVVVRAADEAGQLRGEGLAQQLRWAGYDVRTSLDQGGGHTIPSHAVVEVLRLVDAMKTGAAGES
jgi:poly(3-hydroxybutyrate) depolymerase